MEAQLSLVPVSSDNIVTVGHLFASFLQRFFFNTGDETLRFWQIFPGPRSGEKDGSGGLLFPNTLGSVIR